MSKHWLVSRAGIRWLWVVFTIMLTLSVLAGLLFETHGYFGLDGTFGFNAWYGLGTCIAMVVFAKALALLVKRPDTYYERD